MPLLHTRSVEPSTQLARDVCYWQLFAAAALIRLAGAEPVKVPVPTPVQVFWFRVSLVLLA
jgi:hypothetical protein